MMRNPYVVGRWVSGQNHYGRQHVIDTLLNSPETEFWVVGTRRAGKTSLLHQLEHLTDREGCSWVPLIWDMQGCETSGDLSDELYMAVEDAHQRFEHCGVTVRRLAGLDATVILARLAESIGAAGKKLLLMADEVEVLLRIARSEPAWVTRLHAALSSGNQKTILTSTQLLANLNRLCVGNAHTPFLQNFNVIHLWKLEPEVAAALVEQRQSDEPLAVAPEIIAAILDHTNCNPYLIQYLCHRLYHEADGAFLGFARRTRPTSTRTTCWLGCSRLTYSTCRRCSARSCFCWQSAPGLRTIGSRVCWLTSQLRNSRRSCGGWSVLGRSVWRMDAGRLATYSSGNG
ncbi:MAG: hypothetical protein IPK16_21910 [Anaerolineales bacterium]|nr:hypothetical protein [Anaerolineales bacterium]